MHHDTVGNRRKSSVSRTLEPDCSADSSHRRTLSQRLQFAIQRHRDGVLKEAERLYRECLAEGKHTRQICNNLGAICYALDRFDEAREFFEQAIIIDPSNPETYCNLGATYKRQGKPNEAIAALRQALALSPNCPEALHNLGNVFLEANRPDEAINHYRKALSACPNRPEVLSILGNCLSQQGEFDEAIALIRRSLELRPNDTDALQYLAYALLGSNQLRDAIATYDEALALRSNDPQIHTNFSMLLLRAGDFERGWREYEWRIKARPDLFRQIEMERWNGRTEFAGELVLVCEQGLGDSIQFVRYARLLRSRFSNLSIQAPNKLGELFRSADLADDILPEGALEARADARWLPLLSAPRLLGVTRDHPIISEPYLKALPDRVAVWSTAIESCRDAFVVGINWQGNPKYDPLGERGLALSEFECIARIPGVQLLSLQKGAGSEQVKQCSFRNAFVRCQESIDRSWEFLETAAIVMSCDLVITSDTSVAHLAGALGKPVWVLLNENPDWRWGLRGETTAWYPEARLFRQQQRGDWAGVMARVRFELAHRLDASDSR